MTHSYTNDAARFVAQSIRERARVDFPRVGIILGSGLGGLVHEIEDALCIAYADLPGFADVRVRGHDGQLVVGTLEGVPVAVCAGRFHLYEGHSPKLIGFPVRVLRALGARTLLVTNASGGINRGLAPGDLMIIEDQINLTGCSPLTGPLDDGDARFPDMSDPFDSQLRGMLHTVADSIDVPVKQGVYVGLHGPSYETRAEIRMLHALGADAVGMSTVHEVIVARALSMRVAGIACISNMCAGIQGTPLDHADVLLTTARIADQFQGLVRGFVATL